MFVPVLVRRWVRSARLARRASARFGPLMLLLFSSLAANSVPAPPPFRLPAAVRPLRYALELTVVPSAPSYSGSVAIDLAFSQPSQTIWLHASDLTIESADLRIEDRLEKMRIAPAANGLVAFVAPRPITADRAQLTVRFRGAFDDEKSRGLYRVAEGAGQDDWYAYTFFQPVDARRAFPCFDEPGFKAPWKLTLHVRRDHTALANGPVETERDEAEGMKVVQFAETRPLPSYLVAFIVGPFDLVDAGSIGRAQTPLRFAVPRGRGAETRYARAITGRIVALLEDYFDQPYPFGKLDVAVVPRFWGTMEHPGLVALGQPLTLIQPDAEGIRRQQRYANVAMHELAHYWFGDVVTCRWWDDLWLNEALATWLDGKLTDRLEPAWRFGLGAAIDATASAMAKDSEPTVQPIRLPVTNADAIQNAFDVGITYSKGASVLRMLEHWVGEDAFRAALRSYIAARAWSSADEGDFLEALRRKLGGQVADVLASFVEQPGVPLVSVETRCDGARPRVRLSQRRFFAAGTTTSAALWKIPICLKWGGDAGRARICTVLDSATAEISLPSCPSWLVANADAAGYYRSHYDETALAALRPVLTSELTVPERIMLASDLAAQVDQGSLPLTGALDLVPLFLADGDPRVFAQGVELLFLIKPRELEGDERAAFGRLVVALLGARVKTIGWTPRAGEAPELMYLRPRLLELWARYSGEPILFAEARSLAERWFAERSAVPTDMVPAILTIAALAGERSDFERLLAEARQVHDRRERALLLDGLGAFRTPTLNGQALALLLGQEFDVRETIKIAYRALAEERTRASAWAFLKANFKPLTMRLRDDEVLKLFRAIPSAFCDDRSLDEIAAFLRPRSRARPGAAQVLENAVASARSCARARARNRPAVTAFLQSY